MYAIHRQAVPPSGIAHVVSARLMPSCLQESSTSTSRIVRNMVTANNDYLQIFEVQEECRPLTSLNVAPQANGVKREETEEEDNEEDRAMSVHEMMQASNSTSGNQVPNARARLHFVREHKLHGIITGLQRIRTLDTARDGLDRLLISFKDAKMSLMEWSIDLYDLIPISLHTFEKLPQFIQGNMAGYSCILRTDPLSRCAAMLLPQDSLAITPLFQDQIELEGADSANIASLPYAPSFTIDLQEISPQLRNIIDFVFLPGFNEPTVAILSQPQQTWAGRLENNKDTVQLFLLTLDVTSTPPSSTIISTALALPYDSLYLTPCPKDLGGVLVTTANSIIHLDQAGKRTGLSFNGWANIVSEFSKSDTISDEILPLENSKILFVGSELALLVIISGEVRAFTIQRDGRTISKLALISTQLGRTVAPSDVELIRSHLTPRAEDGSTTACYAFVASLVGDSDLVRIDFRNETIEQADGKGFEETESVKQEKDDEMDEDDIDIYGSADAKEAALSAASAARKAANTKLVLEMSRCQKLPAYGPIRSAAIGTIHLEAPPELVACTGDEATGGLTVIHRSLLPSNRRRLNLDHSTENIWSLKVRPVHLTNGSTTGNQSTYKHYLFTSQDRETQIYALDGDVTEPDHVKTFGKATLAVNTVLNDTCIAYLLQDTIVVLNEDLSERQSIKLPKDAKAKSASFADPYILVSRETAVPLLYAINSGTGRLEIQELPSYITLASKSTLFKNTSSVFPLRRRQVFGEISMTAKPRLSTQRDGHDAVSNDDDIYGDPAAASGSVVDTEVLEVIIEGQAEDDVKQGTQELQPIWLCNCTDRGLLTITCLPDSETVYSSSDTFTFPAILRDSPALDMAEGPSEESVLDQIAMVNIGQDRIRPHLILLMEDGTLVIYEVVPDSGRTQHRDGIKKSLYIRFLKIHHRSLGVARTRPSSRTNGATDSLGPAIRRIIPFADFCGHDGFVITGESPLWVLGEDSSSSRIFDCTVKPLYGFSASSTPNSLRGCLMSVGEDTFVGWMPDGICLARDLPFTKVVENRLFTDVALDHPSQSYVAISSFSAPFEIYNEDGDPIDKTGGADLLEPRATRSALEVIEPGSWRTVDGYEFRQYETALSVQSINLESRSTISGYKDFIAVGTIISRGEDLASRGAIYLFEVIKAEPAEEEASARRYLRLLLLEDLKSAIANVTSINGFLLHSVGLKIYGKALEQDEKLLSIGFLDTHVHTTCIRSMKNLVLIGDAIKGLNFIVFQEDPFKLISLGREVRNTHVVTADFLVSDNRSLFVSTDIYGVVRLFEYDPMRAETQGGQRLLPRVEFRVGSEAAKSIPFARSAAGDVKQSGVLFLNFDGSLSTIVPVRDAVYRRLQLLERQLIRHTHHFAGLNPRAFRTVRNDYVSRPLTKGLLDGDLLSTYTMLSTQRQQQLADPLGSDSDTINYNLRTLKAPW